MKPIWIALLLGAAVGIGGTLWWKERESDEKQVPTCRVEEQDKSGTLPDPAHASSPDDDQKTENISFDAPKLPEALSAASTLEKLSVEVLERLVWEVKDASAARGSPSPADNVAGMPTTLGQWAEDRSEESKRQILIAALKSELAHAKSIQPKATPAGTPQIPKLNGPPGMQITAFGGEQVLFEFAALHAWIHDQDGWVPKRKEIKALEKRGDLRSALLLKLVAENPTIHPMRRVRAIRALVAVTNDEYEALPIPGLGRLRKDPLPSKFVKAFIRRSLKELSHDPKTPKRIAAVAQDELGKLPLKRKDP